MQLIWLFLKIRRGGRVALYLITNRNSQPLGLGSNSKPGYAVLYLTVAARNGV